jgi:hypothetical protein
MIRAELYGRSGSAPAYAFRDFLHRCDIEFKWHELRNHGDARAIGLEGWTRLRIVAAGVPHAVYEEGRRPIDAALRPPT